MAGAMYVCSPNRAWIKKTRIGCRIKTQTDPDDSFHLVVIPFVRCRKNFSRPLWPEEDLSSPESLDLKDYHSRLDL